MKLDKIETLDGLRGLAALLVLWAHFPLIGESSLSKLSKLLSTYTYAGYIGVDIFFALSGFLITRILLVEKYQGTLSFRRFYIKRFLRIFPIYYLSILVVGFMITWKHMGWVAFYASNYFFSFNVDPHPMRHTWSLCVEEHFYLFWPLIIRFFSIQTAKKIIGFLLPLLAIGSAIATVFIFDKQLADDLVYRGTSYRILTLALGSAVAYYEPQIRAMSLKKLQWCLVGGVIILVFMRTYYKIDILRIIPPALIELVAFSCFSLLALVIVVRLNSLEILNYGNGYSPIPLLRGVGK